MIDHRRFTLPAGVALRGAQLHDESLAQSYALSWTGAAAIGLLTRGLTVSQVAEVAVTRWAADPERAEVDIQRLVVTLNEACLLNEVGVGVWQQISRCWTGATECVAMLRMPRVTTRRYMVGASSVVGQHLEIARAVMRGLAWFWAFVLIAIGLSVLIDRSTAALAVIAPATFGALVAHEAGHALAVRARSGRCFLRVRGVSVSIVHSRAVGSAIVHASGPMLAVAWGGALLGCAVLFDVPMLALAGVPFVAQLMTLTVLATDGRRIARN